MIGDNIYYVLFRKTEENFYGIIFHKQTVLLHMLSSLFFIHALLPQRPFGNTSLKCNILYTIISTFSLVCQTHTTLSSFPPSVCAAAQVAYFFAFQHGTLTWALGFWSFPSWGEAAAALRLLPSSCTASNTQWRQVRPGLFFLKFILKPGSLFYEVVTFCIDSKCNAKSFFVCFRKPWGLLSNVSPAPGPVPSCYGSCLTGRFTRWDPKWLISLNHIF